MHNIFLFTGLNQFALRREKLRWIQEFAIKHGQENLLSLDGSDVSLQTMLDGVSAAPFIASNRLIVIVGVPKLAKEDMRRVLEAVHPACVLLFADPAPDKRLGGLKELLAIATVKQFSPLTERQLREWVSSFARECGSCIDMPAIKRLLLIVGPEQDMLSQELRKLALGAGRAITAEHVELLAVPSGDQEIWQLMTLLSHGDLQSSLNYANILLRSGEDPYSLWKILLWMVRCLVGVSLCLSEGERNPAKIALSADVNVSTVKTLLPLAQKISTLALKGLVDWAVIADCEMKTGDIRATAESSQELLALVDELIMRCCAVHAQSAVK